MGKKSKLFEVPNKNLINRNLCFKRIATLTATMICANLEAYISTV